MKSVSWYDELKMHEYKAVKDENGLYTVLEDGEVIETGMCKVLAAFMYGIEFDD
ncbi:MAG: hypothetical protein LIP12_17845 [Clostridiales bacterium]|nr:hypothetical protein [Clostridiales bacterium]